INNGGQSGIVPDQARDLAERPLQTALGAGAVVSDDEEDQRVVEFSGLFDAANQLTDLVVGIGEIGCVVFHQAGIYALGVGGLVIPGGNLFRSWSELGVWRDYAEFLLSGERDLALLVPALIELTLELVAPFLRGVMRGVGRRGRVVHKPGLVLVRCTD